ncbi:MAG: hypothetical protein RMJ55_06735 [Roseiflexaceae bacterium]|nr:hypothetical protein [Roseiflexaceae bacterium]MDW8326138.1 hypothetical protein [Anaerolineales bacterium]
MVWRRCARRAVARLACASLRRRRWRRVAWQRNYGLDSANQLFGLIQIEPLSILEDQDAACVFVPVMPKRQANTIAGGVALARSRRQRLQRIAQVGCRRGAFVEPPEMPAIVMTTVARHPDSERYNTVLSVVFERGEQSLLAALIVVAARSAGASLIVDQAHGDGSGAGQMIAHELMNFPRCR